MKGTRAICRRAEPLSLPSCALSATSQRIVTPAIDTLVVAAGNRLAVAKVVHLAIEISHVLQVTNRWGRQGPRTY